MDKYKFDYTNGKLTPNEVDNLVLELINAFIQFKNKESSNFRLTPKQNNHNIWLKAANLCEKYKIQPYDFVKLCYEDCVNKRRPMFQQMLIGSNIIKLCETLKESNKISYSDIDAYINESIQFAFKMLTLNKDDYMFVLESAGFDIEPWVRILFCKHNENVYKKYLQKAKEQLDTIDGLVEGLKRKNVDINSIFDYDKA